MPIRVTQFENRRSKAKGLREANNSEPGSFDTEGAEIELRVEGTLYRKDAELLERICRDLASQTKKPVKLDLASLSFLDTDSAAVLCRLKHELGFSLEGQQLFISKVVELAEECEKSP